MAQELQHELVANPAVSKEQEGVFADAWNQFITQPTLAPLASLGGPTYHTTTLPPNIHGVYAPDNNTVAINASLPYSGDVLNTVIHEITHRAQNQPGARPPPQVSLSARESANEHGINYGTHEPAAWMVANMIFAPGRAYNDNALRFIDENRSEAARIFREGVNPHIPRTRHVKGEAEMNVFEKALTALTGIPPEIDRSKDRIPPWVEEAISFMKTRDKITNHGY